MAQRDTGPGGFLRHPHAGLCSDPGASPRREKPRPSRASRLALTRPCSVPVSWAFLCRLRGQGGQVLRAGFGGC